MKKRILLVEDNRSLRRILAHYFERELINVVEACDGNNALEVAEKVKSADRREKTRSARAVPTVSRWDEGVAPVRRVATIPTMARRRWAGCHRSSGRAARSSGSPG